MQQDWRGQSLLWYMFGIDIEPASTTGLHSLVVRPIVPSERERFDETLRAEHWLGDSLVGEVMRYVAVENGRWCALLGFGSAALCVRSREELLGWSDAQRYRRLRYITNNQRFCILDGHRRPNLASQVLSATLKRLSSDFQTRWGHPVVMVETFTDPSRHLGTCYQASNFTKVGMTSGYSRKAGHFVHHGDQKVYWARYLHRNAVRLLSSDFDHPLLSPRRTMNAIDMNRLDLDSAEGLLARLESVPDPRDPRGIRHRLAVILSIAVLATLRGATSLVAIGEVAAELPEEALARLSPATGHYVAPEESTIRRMCKAVDANTVDLVTNAWIADQVRSGRLAPDQAATAELAAIVEMDENTDLDQYDDRDPVGEGAVLLDAIAVDGKTLRGARLDKNRQVHLLSAMTHAEGVTIAQRNVETKTNEITGFRPLLEPLDLRDVVITADALHAQREHARWLTEEQGAHYVVGLKDNQPSLARAAKELLSTRPIAYETHGRIEHRYLKVADIPKKLAVKLGFPSASQVVAVIRERADLKDCLKSTETSYYVTDLTSTKASPKHLASYIRAHWGIENRSHWVRDRVFDEDRSQVRVGGAPQTLAALRNLAISLLRLSGFKSIASALRWVAWDHTRGLALMGL